MSILDFFGSLLSLICTYLFIKENKHAWSLSAIAIPFGAFIYYQNCLYGDMSLQFVYLAMTLYGYRQWRNGNNKAITISTLSKNQIIKLCCTCFFSICIFTPLLQPFNQSHIALLDSVTTVMSLCAQWLLCKKKIETWLVWFVVDGLYVYLYIAKGLPFHGLMALIYLFMAISGWLQWHKKIICVDISTLTA